MCVYIYIPESLGYTAEIKYNIANQLYFTKFFLKTLHLIKLKRDPAFKYIHLFKTKSRLQFEETNTKKEKGSSRAAVTRHWATLCLLLVNVRNQGQLSQIYRCSLSIPTKWPSGKDSAGQAGDPGSIPGLGKCPGVVNGNPFQYSFLGNPMDGEAWWATVHEVAKNRTRLSD